MTRRQRGAGDAAVREAGQHRARRGEEGAAKSKTTRFRMIGQTVFIRCPREEWSELKGRYATVLNQWEDGSVQVEVARIIDGKARLCFSRHEVEHVALNDYLRHNATEEFALIARAVFLAGLYGHRPTNGMVADRVMATLVRRVARLKASIRAIQRLNQQSFVKIERDAQAGIGNHCTAIVPCAGDAAALLDAAQREDELREAQRQLADPEWLKTLETEM